MSIKNINNELKEIDKKESKDRVKINRFSQNLINKGKILRKEYPKKTVHNTNQ